MNKQFETSDLLQNDLPIKMDDKVRIMEICCKDPNKSKSEWWVETDHVINGDSVWIKMILI